jgi:hypothetical protein
MDLVALDKIKNMKYIYNLKFIILVGLCILLSFIVSLENTAKVNLNIDKYIFYSRLNIVVSIVIIIFIIINIVSILKNRSNERINF